jgi:hypothetical protein
MLELTVRQVLSGLFAATLLSLLPSLAAGQPAKRVSAGPDKVAIKGYDTVAYFTEGRARKGTAEFEHVWNDARWQFATAGNRERFAADPERYSPQFGGFCAWAMAQGMLIEADPEAWDVVDGKLFLKMSHTAREEWRQAGARAVADAARNWASLR